MTCFPAHSLVVVDSAVLDYQHLIAGLHPDQEVLVLDAAQDGVEQIAQRLQHRQNLTSLHIVSHGQPGALLLGAAQLSFDTLAQYTATLQRWATALRHQASIFLYGCQVAASQQGQAFVRKLHKLTGASIAASTTLVGAAAQGGNWQLDFQVGQVNCASVFNPSVFNPQVLAAYPHALAVLLSETFRDGDVINPNWSFGVGSAVVGAPPPENPFLTARGVVAPSAGGLPGSATGALDPVGDGALRLTNNNTDQSAFVIYNSAFSADAGVSITFDFFAYNGTGTGGATPGGDGISFFLIDGAQSPTTSGAFGGSLGYAQKSADGIPGVVGGYIGVGLDEFGNFANPVDFTGGPVQRTLGPGLVPDSVTVRGTGAGLGGYSFIGTSGTLPGGIDNVAATVRTGAARRARVDITPADLLTVRIDLNFDGDFLDPGEAPTELSNINIVAANGGAVPATFKFGFASSTGNATNIHEVRNLVVRTFSTPPTVVDVAVSSTPNSIVTVPGLSGTDAETSVASFTITSIPPATQGVLFLGNPLVGGTPVAPGQVLTPQQISQLFFQAGPGFTGTTFTYTGTDTDNDTSQVPGTVTLNLGTNQPPTAGSSTVNVTPESPSGIGNLPVTDPDGSITSITVVSLPPSTQGTLFLGLPTSGGTPVTVGQVIPQSQIGQLVFQPTPNFNGTSFTYTATDNQGKIASTPGTITLNRINNTPPLLPGNSIQDIPVGEGPQSIPGLTGTDPDGTVAGYVVTAIPPVDQGQIFIGSPNQGGTPVVAGQRLTPQQINQLFFQPGSGFTNTQLTYAAFDNQGALSNPRTITFAAATGTIPSTPDCQPGETIRGTNGNNTLVGTPDSDVLIGRRGNDRLRGRACDDRVNGNQGNDRIFGNDDNDRLFGQQNNDRLDGGKGTDLLNGGLGRDRLRGRIGSDTFLGRRGNDILIGNGGADRMNGGLSNDRINGGNGNDNMTGERGNDRLIGGTGNDNMNGAQNNDVVDGGSGDDSLNGGLRNDRLLGRSGIDTLLGRRGRDRLKGGSQNDVMDGGASNDTLIGGGGQDALTGGGGRDRFVYRNLNQGLDVILDFDAAEDSLGLQRIFASGNYTRRPIFDQYIRLRASGSDTIVRVDGNGNAPGGFVRLATLVGVAPTELSASNFFV